MDKKDPMTKFLINNGVPSEPDVSYPDSQTVFSFPCKAPEGSVTQEEVSAIEHLELWKTYQEEYCEHKPSVTVQVQDNEWPSVGAWVYENFDSVSGVSFLPRTNHVYKQAPFIPITEEEYIQAASKMPTSIPWENLKEEEDNVVMEPACEGPVCEFKQ